MNVATTFECRPILVFPLQFPKHNRFSTCKSNLSKKSIISRCKRYPLTPPIMMNYVESRDADGDEGVSLGSFDQEALVDGSINFSSGGIQATLNSMSKCLMTAVFGIMILWRRDMEILWATLGGVLNNCLSVALKNILNHERPVTTLRSDPGMPSSHAQSIFYTVAFCIISVVKYFGFNGITAVTSVLMFAMGSYFSWLRVAQRFHTLDQVAVGAVLGFCFSIFWLWLWNAIVLKAFLAHLWVQIVAFVGAAGLCVCLWVIEDFHSK